MSSHPGRYPSTAAGDPPPPQVGSGRRPRTFPSGATGPLPGLAVAAILILVASSYVAVLGSMLGRDLTLSVNRIDNVFFVWFTSVTTGAALLGTAAAAIRQRRITTVAITLLGLHCLALAIILLVQLVINARAQFIALAVMSLLAVALGLVATVVATVGSARATDPAPLGLIAGVVGVLCATASGPVAQLLSAHAPAPSPLQLQVLFAPAALILIAYGARRGAKPLLLVAVGLLALLVVAQIVAAVSLGGLDLVLVTGPVLRILVVLVAILAVIMTLVSAHDAGAATPVPQQTGQPQWSAQQAGQPQWSAQQPQTQQPGPQQGPYAPRNPQYSAGPPQRGQPPEPR